MYILKLRAKTVNDESEKVDEVRTNNKEVENEDFLTISKIVEQKQIFEKRLKYRKVNFKIWSLLTQIFLFQSQALKN